MVLLCIFFIINKAKASQPYKAIDNRGFRFPLQLIFTYGDVMQFACFSGRVQKEKDFSHELYVGTEDCFQIMIVVCFKLAFRLGGELAAGSCFHNQAYRSEDRTGIIKQGTFFTVFDLCQDFFEGCNHSVFSSRDIGH